MLINEAKPYFHTAPEIWLALERLSRVIDCLRMSNLQDGDVLLIEKALNDSEQAGQDVITIMLGFVQACQRIERDRRRDRREEESLPAAAGDQGCH